MGAIFRKVFWAISVPFLWLGVLLGAVVPDLFHELGNWAARKLGIQGDGTSNSDYVGLSVRIVSTTLDEMRVEFEGTTWRARPREAGTQFKLGEMVTVDSVDGLTLTVRKSV